MARCIGNRMPLGGAARIGSRRQRSTATSMRRSAGRPIITPIMSSLIGHPPSPRTPWSAHIFYHWAGEWGQPAIFNKRYAGSEPNALGLRNAALAAEAATAGQNQSVAEAIDKIPGAEVIKLAPSMRGDKRVAVRFNLAARGASATAVHEDY